MELTYNLIKQKYTGINGGGKTPLDKLAQKKLIHLIGNEGQEILPIKSESELDEAIELLKIQGYLNLNVVANDNTYVRIRDFNEFVELNEQELTINFNTSELENVIIELNLLNIPNIFIEGKPLQTTYDSEILPENITEPPLEGAILVKDVPERYGEFRSFQLMKLKNQWYCLFHWNIIWNGGELAD